MAGYQRAPAPPVPPARAAEPLQQLEPTVAPATTAVLSVRSLRLALQCPSAAGNWSQSGGRERRGRGAEVRAVSATAHRVGRGLSSPGPRDLHTPLWPTTSFDRPSFTSFHTSPISLHLTLFTPKSSLPSLPPLSHSSSVKARHRSSPCCWTTCSIAGTGM